VCEYERVGEVELNSNGRVAKYLAEAYGDGWQRALIRVDRVESWSPIFYPFQALPGGYASVRHGALCLFDDGRVCFVETARGGLPSRRHWAGAVSDLDEPGRPSRAFRVLKSSHFQLAGHRSLILTVGGRRRIVCFTGASEDDSGSVSTFFLQFVPQLAPFVALLGALGSLWRRAEEVVRSSGKRGVEAARAWWSALEGEAEGVTFSVQDAEERLDRSIRIRGETDEVRVNRGFYRLLLWVILPLYAYRTRSGVNAFVRRKRAYYRALLDWTRVIAREEGARVDLTELDEELSRAYQTRLRPIDAGASQLMSGPWWVFRDYYRRNRLWCDVPLFDSQFHAKLAESWRALGVGTIASPTVRDDALAPRWRYLALSILTLGAWLAIWDYRIHIDAERNFAAYHGTEDAVLGAVRAHRHRCSTADPLSEAHPVTAGAPTKITGEHQPL
jgi:hypothetical protein